MKDGLRLFSDADIADPCEDAGPQALAAKRKGEGQDVELQALVSKRRSELVKPDIRPVVESESDWKLSRLENPPQ